MENAPPSKTITFNVGGRTYEVARSLLDQYPETMLARLASDTWSPGSFGGFAEQDAKQNEKDLDTGQEEATVSAHGDNPVVQSDNIPNEPGNVEEGSGKSKQQQDSEESDNTPSTITKTPRAQWRALPERPRLYEKRRCG